MTPFPNDQRYINYKLVRRPAKTDKVPVNALTGAAINAHDKKFHLTHAEAARRGLVGRDIFEPEIGVDFDNREQLEAFFHQLPPSYTEYSPSKDPHKVHVWYVVSSGHDRLPSSATKNFEAYSRDRFFTITHDHVPGTPSEIACISFDQAMSIFTLAGYEPKAVISTADDEEGYWSDAALVAVLDRWVEECPDFRFAPYGSKFKVTCPGDAGWFDGQKHGSESGLSRDAVVWIQNGWPCFSCFHAHCRDPKKTWRDLCDHYLINAEQLFDEWLDSRMETINGR